MCPRDALLVPARKQEIPAPLVVPLPIDALRIAGNRAVPDGPEMAGNPESAGKVLNPSGREFRVHLAPLVESGR